MSENDFECLASTGVNTPETMFPASGLFGVLGKCFAIAVGSLANIGFQKFSVGVERVPGGSTKTNTRLDRVHCNMQILSFNYRYA